MRHVSFLSGGLVMLTEMQSKLPPSEQKIAVYILKYPQESLSMTASELGKKSKTSGAAVIRLCKSLNLKGFQQLKLRIAGDLQKTGDQGFRDIEPNETTSSVVQKMTSNTIQTIKETAELINEEELEKAVKALREADSIQFYGVGASYIIASDAQQKFLRINKPTYAFSDLHMAATVVANGSGKNVVVGISFSGETEEVVKLLKVANQNGATTISLTRYGSSPVSNQAKIQLYTSATKESVFRSGATSSRMAQLHMLDILFMCVATQEYENVINYLDHTRTATASLKSSK